MGPRANPDGINCSRFGGAIPGQNGRIRREPEDNVKKTLWILLLALPVMAACSPISATRAISRADESIQAAVAIGADAKCPYEYNAAVISLDFARDCEGMAEFEAATDFATKALKLADDAKKKAALIEDGQTARMDTGVQE